MRDKPSAGPLILTHDTDDARQLTVGLMCPYRIEGSLVVEEMPSLTSAGLLKNLCDTERLPAPEVLITSLVCTLDLPEILPQRSIVLTHKKEIVIMSAELFNR